MGVSIRSDRVRPPAARTPTRADTRQRPLRCAASPPIHVRARGRCTAALLLLCCRGREEKKGTHASGERHAWPIGRGGVGAPHRVGDSTLRASVPGRRSSSASAARFGHHLGACGFALSPITIVSSGGSHMGCDASRACMHGAVQWAGDGARRQPASQQHGGRWPVGEQHRCGHAGPTTTGVARSCTTDSHSPGR